MVSIVSCFLLTISFKKNQISLLFYYVIYGGQNDTESITWHCNLVVRRWTLN